MAHIGARWRAVRAAGGSQGAGAMSQKLPAVRISGGLTTDDICGHTISKKNLQKEMKISRSSRLAALCIALFSMLFMQLAVAAYACPCLGGGALRSMAADATEGHAEMIHCDGMDIEQVGLCQALSHGEASKQSAHNPQIPDVPPFIPVELIQALHLIENFSAVLLSPPVTTSLMRTSAPPIAIRHCCFRI